MLDARTHMGGTLNVRDCALIAGVWSAVLLIIAVFMWLIGDLLLHGAGHLSFSFLIDLPQDAGRSGGIQGRGTTLRPGDSEAMDFER